MSHTLMILDTLYPLPPNSPPYSYFNLTLYINTLDNALPSDVRPKVAVTNPAT